MNKQDRVLWLRFAEDFSVDEIVSEMGISKSQVYRYLEDVNRKETSGGSTWATERELSFYYSLDPEAQEGYKRSFPLRSAWGTIDKNEVARRIGI